MLSHRLLKNHAGLLLIGDYGTLRTIHDVVHDVNTRSPLIRNREGSFLGLAYDVRKAYERQREIINPPKDFEEIGPRYGVQILWPVLLVQQRALRDSLAYIDHGKRHQAVAYDLEAVIEDGLREDFGAAAPDLIVHWQRMSPAHVDFIDTLDSRGGLFCSWTKTERAERIANLLESFDPLYETLYRLRTRSGECGLIEPETLKQWEGAEWPDPRW